jgi:EAL domain-containing protein (putative c-di-GMP-specific phosphodiesterase class I)
LQRFTDGHVIAVEALLRWTHPRLGRIGPDEFIPIAEQTGLINELGTWVLKTACATLGALTVDYGHEVQLGINVSAHQLRDAALPRIVAATLAAPA